MAKKGEGRKGGKERDLERLKEGEGESKKRRGQERRESGGEREEKQRQRERIGGKLYT